MQQTVNIAAGQLARVQMGGMYAAVTITGASAIVSVKLKAGNAVVEELRTVGRGLTVRSDTAFDAVELTSPVATVVELVVTNGRVTVDALDGSTVNVVATTPLPVSNDRGAPGAPVYVSGLTYSDAPATSMVDGAAVAVTAALTAVVSANVNRKAVRFTNVHPANAVALGGGALTWARRCIVLQPGDTWIEERAPNLAWSAICDTALTASVTVQEVLA